MQGGDFVLDKMKCIDEPYEINGDYNSDITANVQAAFVKCDRRY